MINFKQLTIVDNTTIIVNKVTERVYKKDERYVIGVDPYEIEKNGKNVFKVYDKMNMSYCMVIHTKKKFDEVLIDVLKYYKEKELIISKKFVDLDGNPTSFYARKVE